jgi:hypothetical protein
MTPSRGATVLRRVKTEGPYINERMSILVLRQGRGNSQVLIPVRELAIV